DRLSCFQKCLDRQPDSEDRSDKQPQKESPFTVNKFEIAAALQEIGLLLRIKGTDQYRWRAYARAAQAVAETGDNFPALVDNKRLTEIKGVGASLAAVIEDLYKTGRSPVLEKLREELPQGVLTLSKIPGLTVTKIQALNRALGISSVADLKAALAAGKLRDVPGFGAKTENALREQISRLENRDDRILLFHALRAAEKVVDYMHDYAGLTRIDIAGSARRWKETVSMIRITAAVSKAPEAAVQHFLSFPPIVEVESQDQASAIVKLMEGVRVSFSAAAPDEYWNLLHSETGSRAHLDRIEEIAKSKRIQWTPRKLKSIGKRATLKVEKEADIYRHLGMQYVPPELREDAGEIEDALAGKIPDDLILLEDIRGMVHCHTTYSDGRNSVEEMALAAQSMGMKYMTITDHSP